jgi:hypothetical protein
MTFHCGTCFASAPRPSSLPAERRRSSPAQNTGLAGEFVHGVPAELNSTGIGSDRVSAQRNEMAIIMRGKSRCYCPGFRDRGLDAPEVIISRVREHAARVSVGAHGCGDPRRSSFVARRRCARAAVPCRRADRRALRQSGAHSGAGRMARDVPHVRGI